MGTESDYREMGLRLDFLVAFVFIVSADLSCGIEVYSVCRLGRPLIFFPLLHETLVGTDIGRSVRGCADGGETF